MGEWLRGGSGGRGREEGRGREGGKERGREGGREKKREGWREERERERGFGMLKKEQEAKIIINL